MRDKVKQLLRKVAILKMTKEEVRDGDTYICINFIGVPLFKKFVEQKD